MHSQTEIRIFEDDGGRRLQSHACVTSRSFLGDLKRVNYLGRQEIQNRGELRTKRKSFH